MVDKKIKMATITLTAFAVMFILVGITIGIPDQSWEKWGQAAVILWTLTIGVLLLFLAYWMLPNDPRNVGPSPQRQPARSISTPIYRVACENYREAEA